MRIMDIVKVIELIIATLSLLGAFVYFIGDWILDEIKVRLFRPLIDKLAVISSQIDNLGNVVERMQKDTNDMKREITYAKITADKAHERLDHLTTIVMKHIDSPTDNLKE